MRSPTSALMKSPTSACACSRLTSNSSAMVCAIWAMVRVPSVNSQMRAPTSFSTCTSPLWASTSTASLSITRPATCSCGVGYECNLFIDQPPELCIFAKAQFADKRALCQVGAQCHHPRAVVRLCDHERRYPHELRDRGRHGQRLHRVLVRLAQCKQPEQWGVGARQRHEPLAAAERHAMDVIALAMPAHDHQVVAEHRAARPL